MKRQLLICIVLLFSLFTTSVLAIDSDRDRIADEEDNCLNIYNPDQEDSDNDKIGDACEKKERETTSRNISRVTAEEKVITNISRIKREEPVRKLRIDKGDFIINDRKALPRSMDIKIRGRNLKIAHSERGIVLSDRRTSARGNVSIEYENNTLIMSKSRKQINILPSTITNRLSGVREIEIVDDEDAPKYNIQRNVRGKLFGFFDVNISTKVQLNAENGAVIKEDKPFWSVIVLMEPTPEQIIEIQDFECGVELSQIELPLQFEALSGTQITTITKEAALQLLADQAIITAADLISKLNSTGAFAQLSILTGILPESLIKIALRAEMRCVYNQEAMSTLELDLLDSAGFKSVYQLGLLNTDSLQPKALSYTLDKTAIAKGYPFYDVYRQEILVAVPPEKIIEWLNTAKNVEAAFTTNWEKDEIIFNDGSEFNWQEPQPEPEMIGADCYTMNLKDWQSKGLPFAAFKPGILKLDVALPYSIPNATVKVFEDDYPQSFAKRAIPEDESSVFVRLQKGKTYKIQLPDAASISQDIVSEATVCAKFIEQEQAPHNATLIFKKNELKYFYITTPASDDVNVSLSWFLGAAKYWVGYPPNQVSIGGLTQNTQTASWNSPPDLNLNQPQNLKDWDIIVGHFDSFCVLEPDCYSSTLLNFIGKDWGKDQGSFIGFEWKRTTLPQRTYYLGYFSKALFSNDAETAAWEGEMNSFGDAQLVDAQQDSINFQFEYPNYNYKEVEDYGEPYSNLPIIYPDRPLIGMQSSHLGNYELYSPSFTAYEDDSALLHYLNPMTWYQAASDLYSAISNGVACVVSLGTAVNLCAQAVCSTISSVGSVSETVIESEDEDMGTGIAHITKDARFGLEQNQKYGSFKLEGSSTPDGSDWYDDVQKVGDYCSKFAAGDPVEYAKLAYSKLKDDDTEQPRWVKADYDIQTFETYPVISGLKVNLTKIHIYNDRDGTGRGAGDMYTYTTIGVIGDKGQLPGPNEWSGNPVSDDKLAEWNSPFADIDLMRYPSSGEDDTNDGGDMNPKRIVFHRKYLSGMHISALYIETVTFDSDSFEDDEVGVHSKTYTFPELWQFVINCQAGLESFQKVSLDDGDWCKVIIKEDDFTRTFLKGGENKELWGNKDSRVEYEIWINPFVWP